MPSSIATCKMNFSAIKFIKNKLHNILGDKFLDDLLLGFLEKDLVNKILNNEDLRERIVDEFRDLGSGSANNNISRKFYLWRYNPDDLIKWYMFLYTYNWYKGLYCFYQNNCWSILKLHKYCSHFYCVIITYILVMFSQLDLMMVPFNYRTRF